jgi:methyltransferase (TIGR00027 family)
MTSDLSLRNISDTARWVAIYRARETERANPLFRDPFARRLAGRRGEEIAASLPSQQRNEWAWVTRTVLFDRFIAEGVAQGADLIVNLAAGLDARPYRMSLPASLRWVEVDLPEILEEKAKVLAGETPVCALERVPLDLKDERARRDLFRRLGSEARQALVVTEGLLIYLTEPEVGALASDLAAPESFRSWILDLASPGLRRMMERQIGPALVRAGSPFRFAPEEGPEFFVRYGWLPAQVRSTLKEAARLKRLPLWLRLFAALPDPTRGPGPRRIWSATCRLDRTTEAGTG